MIDSDPLWYKDAVLYEVHVRAFHDSIGDGQGDFRGLTEKLDYLEDLGVTTVWLLPFYPSPLKDDGYDIADYTDINLLYGQLADFKEFLDEAHRRGLRVITELVINHTSDQHPWFQRARRAPPGSSERDFYVWSDTTEKYKEARIIFKDFERSNWTWDPVANAYYWHRFYSHQPDLNYDNPAVRAAVLPVIDFWLEMGVDGMRLDAVPYLVERDGTNCENLPETHAVLKELRAHVDARFPNRMFLAEANQWPEDAVAYFGNGDECQMAFHFPLMPRLFMALHQEDRFPIVDILDQTPAIPENCQWCQFLRNHDELTLEMVTDEERDSMYRAYARDRQARINLGIRRRLAPLLRNDRRRIELMNGLLFSLPGAPVIYYGDEIGMGDNIYLGDRNGVRTPMQWSPDRNAGFSRANPQKLYLPVIIDPEYHFESINVEAQQNNPTSLLWWMKRLIALRKRFKAFSRGTLELLQPHNPKILAFIRHYPPLSPPGRGAGGEGDERILVVANLSRFAQFAELNLKEFQGMTPHELFSGNEFPPIGELPYLLTLGPHAFFWFALAPSQSGKRARGASLTGHELPVLKVRGGWDRLFHNSNQPLVEALLPEFLTRRRMTPGPGRVLSVTVETVQSLTGGGELSQGLADVRVLVLQVDYDTGDSETTMLPLFALAEDQAVRLLEPVEAAVLARLAGEPALLVCDALADPDYCLRLLRLLGAGERQRFGDGELAAVPLPGFAEACGDILANGGEAPAELKPSYNPGERTDPSILFGERAVYKAYRRLEAGINPDLEMSRFLNEPGRFAAIAPLLGYFEYRRPGLEPTSMAVLHCYVPNQGDGWQATLDRISGYFERVSALPDSRRDHPPSPGRLLDPIPAQHEKDDLAELIGPHLPVARLLGERTAELHLALASDRTDPVFAPEPFSRAYQRLHLPVDAEPRWSGHGDAGGRSGRPGRNHPGAGPAAAGAGGPAAAAVPGRAGPQPRRAAASLSRQLASAPAALDRQRHCLRRLRGRHHPAGEREADQAVAAARPGGPAAFAVRGDGGVAARPGLGTWQDAGPGAGGGPCPARPVGAAWHGRVARELTAAYFEQIGGLVPELPESRLALLEVFLLECALRDIVEEMVHRRDWVVVPLTEALRLLAREDDKVAR